MLLSAARDDLESEAAMFTHLYEVVRQRAVAWPNAIALGSQQGLLWKTVDSRQLLDLTDRLADELAQRGIREGDRVITWLPSSWQTPIYLFACWKLGAIVVPFDREMNQDAAARIVERVEPRLIVVDGQEPPAWAPDDLSVTWWEPGSRGGTASGPWTQPAEALAAIFFTSGTTGNPKGCMISHSNLTSQLVGAADVIPLDTDCRLASILPLSHLFEMTCGMLYPISRGSAIHYVPSRRGPDILRVLQEQAITHMVAVPQLLTIMGQTLDGQLREKLPAPVYTALFKLADRLPFGARRKLFFPIHKKMGGSMRLFAAGGAALPAETQRLWEKMGVRVVQGYGTSECSPIIAGSLSDGSTPVGSVGRPLRGVSVRLTPEGELQAHGPNVMRGYWKDPERTAEVLHDGWYSTGDLARIDEQGNIFLAGRAKELIVLPSGLNVWPEDVETALKADAAVKDAAIIGVPTAGGGMVLHAYLIPASEAERQRDVSPIVAAANGRLAQHQRVATASWWPDPDFPRTSTLKVRRHLLPLPEAVQATAIDSTLAADDPVGQAVATVAKVPSVTDAQTLGELGLDSLAMLDLGLALEDKTGKAVGESDLTLDMTVAQVRETLAKAPPVGAGSGGAPRRGSERINASQPLWPYTWGRVFRGLRFPLTLAYRTWVTKTVVLGEEHLTGLPQRLILAGTHHAHADEPLVRTALAKTPAAASLSNRLVVAARANAFDTMPGPAAWYAILALGLYPLRQYGEQDVSLRVLARLVQGGNPLLIFPQGRHTPPSEERAGLASAVFKPGVGHLAAALDAAVLPFGLAGTEGVMPEDEHLKPWFMVGDTPILIRKGPLAIAFGAPLRLEPGESPVHFTQRLQDASFALTRQAEAALSR
ncbi:MAG: AMP-binding protein [Chloroflexi bacterium]|nr:AMP-binding protein [Chloroflexota bacterium]